jgi:hypothetical protein
MLTPEAQIESLKSAISELDAKIRRARVISWPHRSG